MGHGHLNMGQYADDIDVKMWLPEMNSVNTTIFCDRLIEKYNDGIIAIRTELSCISTLNIEYQSSGFSVMKEDHENGIMLLKVDPSKIKKHLFIPKKWMSGFIWSENYMQHGIIYKPKNMLFCTELHYNKVPIQPYAHKYILDFSVSGEFSLEIYFMNKKNEPFMIFSKSYCCK